MEINTMKKRRKKSGTDFMKKVEEALLSGKPVKSIVSQLAKLIEQRKREEARQLKADMAEIKQQLEDVRQEIDDTASFIREQRMRTLQAFDA